MRDFKGMKRQRGRNRSSGGGSSSGGKPQHNTNRAFDSNGPEGVKVRGAAQHVYEKYQQLARDAHTAGDRVLAENHLQHAEHYFRLMRAMQPQRPLAEIIGRDQFVSGYDIDFEDEGAAGETPEPEAETAADGAEPAGERQDRFEPRRDDGPREEYRVPREDYRQADQRNRDERPREDRAQSDRSQSDRGQNDRSQNGVRDDRSNRTFRDERPRPTRDERPRFERHDRPAVDPLTVIEPQAMPLTTRPEVSAGTPVLRADDGEVNHAPAFLQVRPVEPRDEIAGEARPSRRRRAPKSPDAAPSASSPDSTEES